VTVFDGIPFLEDAQDWFEDFYSETVGGIHWIIDTLRDIFGDFAGTVAGAFRDIWDQFWPYLWDEYSEAVWTATTWTENIPEPWRGAMRVLAIWPAFLYVETKKLLDQLVPTIWAAIPDWLKSGIADVASWVKGAGADIYRWVEDLPDKLTSLGEDVKTHLTGVVKSGVNDVLGGVADWIGKFIEKLAEGFGKLGDVIGGVIDGIESLGSGLAHSIGSTFEHYTNFLSEQLEKVFNWLLNLGKHVVGGAKDILGSTWEAVTGAVEWLVEKIHDGIKAIVDFLKPTKIDIKGPDDAWMHVLKVIGKVMVMAVPFAVAIIAGELIHPLKSLGFGHAAALLWEASNFSVIGEDLIKTITYALMTLPLRYSLFYWSTPRIPEEEMIFPLIERGVLDKDTFIDVFKKMGYSEYWGNLYWDTHWEEPSVWDLTKMLWRGLIDEEEFKKWLKYIGYEPSLWDKFLALTQQIPPASDLIEFVVKEAFPLEQLPEAPAEFTKYMKMQGYDEKWARAYWWVHWRMPSFEQLQEAFFRGIISLDEFRKYIVWWDYAPFKRPGISKSDQEIMEELIYRMPDKLDIRFMLRWGIIDTEEAAKLFKMTGIHPDWVEKVAEANFMNLFQDERTQLRNAILSMYRDGYLTEEETRQLLLDAKFTKEETEILLKAYRMNKEKDLNDLLLDYYKQLFKKGLITKSQFIGDLVNQGWDEKLIRKMADLLEVMYQKVERPDETRDDRNRVRTQLVNMYKEGYITEDELRAELEALKYSPDEIELTIQEANLKYQYDYNNDLVKVLKTAFKKGQLTVEELRAELSKVIKVKERVDALIALWNLEMMPKPKIQAPSSS